MPEMARAVMTDGRWQNSGRKLPPGIHGMGELMVQVLARNGLEIVEDGGQQVIARTSSSIRPSPQTHRLRPLQDLDLASLQESLVTC